jgi:hypothetical protein
VEELGGLEGLPAAERSGFYPSCVEHGG